jgi:hypothetical protein
MWAFCGGEMVFKNHSQKFTLDIYIDTLYSSLHMCPNDNNALAEWEIRVQQSCGDAQCTEFVIENAAVDQNNFPECFGKTPVISTLRPLASDIPFVASVASGNNNDDGAGSFILTLVNHVPPTNSVCSGAVPLTVNAAAVELSFANTIENEGGCVPAAKNIWFSFVGTGNQVAVRAC